METMARYKVRWVIPALTGGEWIYGPNVHEDLESAKRDARDAGGYEGVGPVQVFRDEGDAGIVEWELDD